MHLPYEQILADFKDPLKLQELKDAIGWTMATSNTIAARTRHRRDGDQ